MLTWGTSQQCAHHCLSLNKSNDCSLLGATWVKIAAESGTSTTNARATAKVMVLWRAKRWGKPAYFWMASLGYIFGRAYMTSPRSAAYWDVLWHMLAGEHCQSNALTLRVNECNVLAEVTSCFQRNLRCHTALQWPCGGLFSCTGGNLFLAQNHIKIAFKSVLNTFWR